MVSRMIRFIAPAAGLMAAGCIQLPDAPDLPDLPIASRAVDPTSPAALRVLQAAEAARTAEFPSFQDIPAYPNDVRPPAAWNAAARDVMGARDSLQQWRRANPPELTNTEAFARSQRQAVGDVSALPAAPTPEESAAYAREQRRRASEQ